MCGCRKHELSPGPNSLKTLMCSLAPRYYTKLSNKPVSELMVWRHRHRVARPPAFSSRYGNSWKFGWRQRPGEDRDLRYPKLYPQTSRSFLNTELAILPLPPATRGQGNLATLNSKYIVSLLSCIHFCLPPFIFSYSTARWKQDKQPVAKYSFFGGRGVNLGGECSPTSLI